MTSLREWSMGHLTANGMVHALFSIWSQKNSEPVAPVLRNR